MISAIETTITKLKKNCDKQMLDSLSQTKTKGIWESFDKHLVQAAVGAKYKLGFGTKKQQTALWKKI